MTYPNDYLNKIICGDCLEVMRGMPDNFVDSVVTDPPYGLSFMGKHWDYGVPTVEIWRECLRVLKPGGHLLSFAGTRTYHRMAVNIEDAGFEIRDMIAWIYGSGFPKSLNIGKAIDKLQGNERVITETGNTIPDIRANNYENSVGKERLKETVSTGTGKWEGWGTALKPALEPICVARKPLAEKTVAENVLKYGTGGINVDGGRVDVEVNNVNARKSKATNHTSRGVTFPHRGAGEWNGNQGRFPANLIHDGSEEVLAVFPDTNPSKSGHRGLQNSGRHGGLSDIGGNIKDGTNTIRGHEDTGGSASRFFYCAKASKQDRDEGCEELEEQKFKKWNERPGNRGIADKYPDGSPRPETLTKNNHPTVKPTALMRYLCRLITPPNGIILDPFGGSGSTGKGAKLEGFNYIIIEREAEYCEIAQKRIDGTLVNKKLEFKLMGNDG